MRERYEITSIEQMRAVADLLRLRIIRYLEKRPMTVTQLGEELSLAPGKVHYHVRELEKVGLLKLVETREKGGILEKYYQPVAHEILLNKDLLAATPDEALAATRALLNQISDGYLQAFRHFAVQSDPADQSRPEIGMNIHLAQLSLTIEEQRQLVMQINELLAPFEKRRVGEDEREVIFTTLIHPTTPVAETQEGKAMYTLQTNWTVGAAVYSRDDLLRTRAANTRLQLNVVGYCHFANDIEASLANDTIASFKLIGRLTASPDVREVLKQ